MLRSIRPTRARRPSDASVDPTEARGIAGFGLDDCSFRRGGNGARRSRWLVHRTSENTKDQSSVRTNPRIERAASLDDGQDDEDDVYLCWPLLPWGAGPNAESR